VEKREGRGTPQGSVRSPLLANLIHHYVLDKRISRRYKGVKFERYADDVVIHSRSQQEAEGIVGRLKERLKGCKLELNEEKTGLLYCKDYKRAEGYREEKFDLLGYSFQARSIYDAKKQRGGVGFSPAKSEASKRKIKENLKRERILKNREETLKRISEEDNARLGGWMRYYGRYKKYKLTRVLGYLDYRVVKRLTRK
jgi:hypothetical protein